MNRFNTERMLGLAVGLFVLAVAASITLGSIALVKAVNVNRVVKDPTVRESRAGLSKSIKRYSKPQLRRLLKRLLSVATPAQVREVERAREEMKPRGNRSRNVPASTRRPRQSPDDTTSRPRAPQPVSTPRPARPPEPAPAVTPSPVAPAAPAGTAAPAATPAPVITTNLPLVPLQVCTGLLAVNCS